MALNALTLAVTSGVQGRRFQSAINGLTTGKVEVLNDGSPGFSTVNGQVISHGLPYPVSTVVLREYEPGVGQGYRDTRIDITAATAGQIYNQALGLLSPGRALVRYRTGSERQPDGSIAFKVYAEDDLGATISAPVGVKRYLTNPSGLARFKAAMATAATAPVHIVIIGDSIGEGVGTESPSTINSNEVADTDSFGGKLRLYLSTALSQPAGGGLTPFYSGTDSRVVRSGSPSADLTASIGTARSARIKNSTSDYIDFTTPACTNIDILFYAGGSADGTLIGGFTYQLDGGTETIALPAGANASPGHRVFSLNGLSNQPHTIRLKAVHATNLQVIEGIRYHMGRGVTVTRFARAGWTLLDMLGIGDASRNNGASNDANSRLRVSNAWGGFGETLVIVELGQNDGTFQTTAAGGTGAPSPIGTIYSTPDTYEAYLRQQIAKVAAAGGCTLLLNTALPPPGGVTVPSGGAPYYEYHNRARKIAGDTAHVAHLSIADIWGISGDASAAANVADGRFAADTSVHPSKKGHDIMAQNLLAELLAL